MQQGSRLEPCLRANRAGRWVYARADLPEREGRETRIHVRQVGVDRLSEGVLEERPFLRLERYLDLRSEAASRPSAESAATRPSGEPAPPGAASRRRPRAPLKGGTAVFFRLDEPADPIPAEVEWEGVITSETPVTYFDYRGIPQARGTLTRRTEFEGVEDVECPAGRFEGCLRMRVDLSVHFRWIAIVDLTTYLWLSPEVGEVRRVQRLSGWFLIFPFASADEYRLISYTPPAQTSSSATVPPPMWRTGAVLLEGDYPGIRIAGMVIDMETGGRESP
jgi:hypothetical protein